MITTSAKSFEGWFKAQHEQPKQLYIGQGVKGKGLIAAERIRINDVVLRLPERILLKQSILKDGTIHSDEYLLLTLTVIKERVIGWQSRWAPYLDILFEEEQVDHPFMWSEEVAEAIDGTVAGIAVKQTRSAVYQSYQQALCILDQINGVEQLDYEVYKKAIVKVSSRTFQLSGTLYMAPWADLLNHSSSAGEKSCLHWEEQQADFDERTCIIRAHRNYEIGEEIFDSYGLELTQSHLLAQYGFVDTQSPIGVPVDRIIQDHKQGKLSQQVLNRLHEVFGLCEMRFDGNGLDQYSQTLLRVLVSTDDEIKQLGWSASNSVVQLQKLMGALSQNSTTSVEARWQGMLCDWITRHLTMLDNKLNHISEMLAMNQTIVSDRCCLLLAKQALQAEWERFGLLKEQFQEIRPLRQLDLYN